jgi:hypothetical protein
LPYEDRLSNVGFTIEVFRFGLKSASFWNLILSSKSRTTIGLSKSLSKIGCTSFSIDFWINMLHHLLSFWKRNIAIFLVSIFVCLFQMNIKMNIKIPIDYSGTMSHFAIEIQWNLHVWRVFIKIYYKKRKISSFI